MLEKVDSCCWQNHLDWPEIEDWSDDSHRIVLIGKASHPPYVCPFTAARYPCSDYDALQPCSTQSCGLSVEAAAVLSALLSYVRSLDHIPHLVSAYETTRRERSKFLHKVGVTSAMQPMLPPGPARKARGLEMQKLLRAKQHKWGDDAYLGLWGQLCQVWAYDAFDAVDNWWVQWGLLRERAMCPQNPNVQLPWNRLEVSVSAHTGYI
jgi:salicylate hydroxylase